MLAEINHYVHEGYFKKGCFARLKQYQVQEIKGKKYGRLLITVVHNRLTPVGSSSSSNSKFWNIWASKKRLVYPWHLKVTQMVTLHAQQYHSSNPMPSPLTQTTARNQNLNLSLYQLDRTRHAQMHFTEASTRSKPSPHTHTNGRSKLDVPIRARLRHGTTKTARGSSLVQPSWTRLGIYVLQVLIRNATGCMI